MLGQRADFGQMRTYRAYNYRGKAMGYDFHITRKDHWADDEGPAISLEEWAEYARGDTDINPDTDNPGAENWIVTVRKGACPLWWDNTGEILAKDPGPTVIEKMITIANALGARVLGDDGEVYGEPSPPSG